MDWQWQGTAGHTGGMAPRRLPPVPSAPDLGECWPTEHLASLAAALAAAVDRT